MYDTPLVWYDTVVCDSTECTTLHGVRLDMIQEAIRSAIQADGRSLRRLALACGLTATDLSRFVRGKQGLSLASADRLCGVLGLSIVANGRPHTPEPRPQEARHEAIEPKKVQSTVEPQTPHHEPAKALAGHWVVTARQPDGSLKRLGQVEASDMATARRLAQRAWPNVRAGAFNLSP